METSMDMLLIVNCIDICMRPPCMYRSMTVTLILGVHLLPAKKKRIQSSRVIWQRCLQGINGSALHAANICLTHEARFIVI